VNPRRKNGVLIAALIAAAIIGGYALGRHHTEIDIAAAAAERTPLYYQDPSGKPDYSPTPKKDAEGRDYVPVYDEPGAAPANPPTPPGPAAAPGGDRKILYYRNPMGLPDTSPVPKKDSMGMDYIPVYADEGSAAVPGTVAISPERIQMLGVRTETASLRSIAHTVRAVGTVAADERRIGVVNPKFEGWIEQLHVNTTGQAVRPGTPLLEVYSPDWCWRNASISSPAGRLQIWRRPMRWRATMRRRSRRLPFPASKIGTSRPTRSRACSAPALPRARSL
jgi:Cu(I)/Ag(I) efflux system membrane fusion protein